MKGYLITTAIAFGALTLIHVWRLAEEGPDLFGNPFWTVSSVVAAALCVWACRLLWIKRGGGT